MNLYFKTTLVLLLIFTSAISHGQTAKVAIIRLTANDSVKTHALRKGQKFIITLPDHVDGGYRFNAPLYNRSVLALIRHNEIRPGNNGRPGEPGYTTWEFIATKKGASTLKITASRPWTKKSIIISYAGMVLVK